MIDHGNFIIFVFDNWIGNTLSTIHFQDQAFNIFLIIFSSIVQEGPFSSFRLEPPKAQGRSCMQLLQLHFPPTKQTLNSKLLGRQKTSLYPFLKFNSILRYISPILPASLCHKQIVIEVFRKGLNYQVLIESCITSRSFFIQLLIFFPNLQVHIEIASSSAR